MYYDREWSWKQDIFGNTYPAFFPQYGVIFDWGTVKFGYVLHRELADPMVKTKWKSDN